MAVDMLKERLINEKMAITRVKPEQLDELLHPIVDPAAEAKSRIIARGLPAGPGGASGQIVFTAGDAVDQSIQFSVGDTAFAKDNCRLIRVFGHVWFDDVRYVHGQHLTIITLIKQIERTFAEKSDC